MKTPENQRFSGIFRGYKMGTLARNGLIRNHFFFGVLCFPTPTLSTTFPNFSLEATQFIFRRYIYVLCEFLKIQVTYTKW